MHVGRAELPLKDLLSNEAEAAKLGLKPPSVQLSAEVYAVGLKDRASVSGAIQRLKPLGKVTIKMRLRKPIEQALRYIRE